jgi:hypothetical protein
MDVRDFCLLCVVCFLFIEGPRSRFYGPTAALRLIVQPCDEDEEVFFCFSLLMEQRLNEIDRGEPKYSEKNLSQFHFANHKSHTDRPRTPW